MRKLLNTVYVTNENAYLSLDGENMVCRLDESEKFRIPFDNVEAVICFSYAGCSPALMGKCAEKLIPISFISPNGKFLAKVSGETRGNIFLRVSQIDVFREKELQLAINTTAAKLCNSISVMNRSKHDNPALRQDKQFLQTIDTLRDGVQKAFAAESLDTLLGIEGNCASAYFSTFGKMFSSGCPSFEYRTKRPPTDPINAALSFIYTIYTSEFAAALEVVGLDSYYGFYHRLRSGRTSLACDLVEEARCLADRFVLTMFNLRILSEADFEHQASGAVWLNADGRRKILTKWQEKKRTELKHPYLNQKIPFGLLPYVQSNLLAKYIRGEIKEYPCYLL